ncbi:hypothetical protein QU977_23600, partial [Escherichia coli]|nr:hypothetical protein [Escherichia coli]
DRNRSHWSTSKTPSYTKSVSWQHHLLSVLDVKTYRDDARLNEWISNRVQELGDRYYPVNKHVKIRYTL